MRFVFCILMTIVLAMSLGCAGDNRVNVVVPPDPCIEFAPSQPSASGTVSSRLGADSTCLLAAVEIVGTDIDDVFAVAALIEYDPAAIDFVSMSTAGSALGEDGAQILAQAVQDPLGEITIGAARNADDAVDIVGTELLVTLYFQAIALGSGDVNVPTPCLTDGGENPVPRNDVACSGGTLMVIDQN
jgi:hypothetical protein